MSDQLVLFDYGALDVLTQAVVKEHATAIHTLARRSAHDLIEIGERLLAVKDHLDHGQFLGWLSTEFAWTRRTAVRFMEVAECAHANKWDNLSHLPGASVLCLLAQPGTPAEVRDAIIERAADGERVSVADTRTLIAEAREQDDESSVFVGRDGTRYETQRLPPAPPIEDDEEDDQGGQPGFELPELERESPEEKAYHTLSRLTIYANQLQAADVAAACDHADGAAYRFRALTTWLESVTAALEDRVQRPVRSVK